MCEHELNQLDLLINVKSRVACAFVNGMMSIVLLYYVLTVCTPLAWVDSIRYLGVLIVRSCKFKCSFDNAKRSFFQVNKCAV